ncbi:7348_t:CDS:2 [Diversispora eburnea]|uniref:7348_t:CDS:1 n=1 Tax=Diversispora eburnea TaxID=1213867 RepID=A0A9N8V0C0_9GLOM|nr:7348_t:CDS:2 [Diversispora eburnea]
MVIKDDTSDDTVSDTSDFNNVRYIDEPEPSMSIPLKRQRHRRISSQTPTQTIYIDDEQPNRSEQERHNSWRRTPQFLYMLYPDNNSSTNLSIYTTTTGQLTFERGHSGHSHFNEMCNHIISKIRSTFDANPPLLDSSSSLIHEIPTSWLEELYKILPSIIEKILKDKYFTYIYDIATRAAKEVIKEFVKSDPKNRADFALHSGGARVVPYLTTSQFTENPKGLLKRKLAMLFGFGITQLKQPEIVISSDNNVGNCYCFGGSSGQIAIDLSRSIEISSITYVHLDPNLALEKKDLKSAPKDFEILVINERNQTEINNTKTICLGKFTYKLNKSSAQNFEINYNQSETIPIAKRVIFKVQNNWGEKNYTCMYQIQVHGKVVTNKD